MNKRIKAGVVFLLLLLVSGCGFSLMYNHANWLINWYVDDYIDFNREQQLFFDQRFEQLHLWHRKEQLPIYRRQLQQLKQNITDGLTEEHIDYHFSEIRYHWFTARKQAQGDLLAMASSLSAKQKQTLLDNINEIYQGMLTERHDESDKKRWQRQNKALNKQFRQWFGNLSAAQQELIKDYQSRRIDTFELWMAYRQRWLTQFEQAIVTATDMTIEPLLLNELIVAPESLRGEQLQQTVVENFSHFRALVVELMASASVKQRAKLNKQIDGYIDDLDDLIKDSG